MRWSKLFIPTMREEAAGAQSISHKLFLRAGYIRQMAAGVYALLPLAHRVRLKIMQIIRQEMDKIGAQELLLSALQPAELWQESGRWKDLGEIMFRLKDRKGADMALGVTHEEAITSIARDSLRSYRDLPQIWYQIQTKFRDEARPKSGLLRVREFTMKDSYSFDINSDGLDKAFSEHYDAYCQIFSRCGLSYIPVDASSGDMGGSQSTEFMVESDAGEDTIVLCHDCGYAANIEKAASTDTCVTCEGSLELSKAIEIGHIFKLGTKYSESMNAHVVDSNGMRRPITMGSYGIGIERVMATIAETSNDDAGLIWPLAVAPFQAVVTPTYSQESEVTAGAERIYSLLLEAGVDVLMDDRDERAGVKFIDSDLIGIPYRITVGKKIQQNQVELFTRANRQSEDVASENIVDVVLDKIAQNTA